MSTKSVLDNILAQLANKNQQLEIVLLGGEPSLHPLYFYILDELEKLPNLKASAVISNAGRKVNNEWIDKHEKYKNFWFNYTFHPSETPDIHAGFIDKIIYTRERYDNVIVNVMMVGDKWDNQIDEVLRVCDDNNIITRANVLFKPKTCDNYMITSDRYREWIKGYTDRFERYLYFSKNSLPRNRPDKQTPTGTQSVYNDIEVYLYNLNKFKGWKCLNNNYAIEGSNNTTITRMCDNNQKDTYMICNLDRCVCQGLLTNEKYI
jgi:hypothetical protein